MYFYNDGLNFIFSNFTSFRDFAPLARSSDNSNFLLGYCFANGNHFRNQEVDDDTAFFIESNNVEISGVYCLVSTLGSALKLSLDPLCQYNIFYYLTDNGFAVSSSIDFLSDYLGLCQVDEEYLYDQLAYQSPMRRKSILKDVSYICFDDLRNASSSKVIASLAAFGVTFNIPNYNKYDELNYAELLDVYIRRLNERAEILSSKFDEVHIQLTGGADSRLVLSSFLNFSNKKCYVYGDGASQNRVIFEHLLKGLGIDRVDNILFVGQPLVNSSRMFRGLKDSNYLKFNNLNTYMNVGLSNNLNICKVTGYYGANVSGSVVLPPPSTIANKRLDKIPENKFSYHSYVNDFKLSNSGLRRAEFNDLFYINNRGKSHYASHSIADNYNVSSIDVLYDYLNILLVKKCPYTDFEIDKNAISIDLIYKNHRQLALFPYDSRMVPKYRAFSDLPLINCFDGYSFEKMDLSSIPISRSKIDDSVFDYLTRSKDVENFTDIFSCPEIAELTKDYPDLEYLTESNDIQSGIYLFFILARYRFERRK